MRVVKAGKNKSFLKTLNIRKHKAVVHESKSISTLKKNKVIQLNRCFTSLNSYVNGKVLQSSCLFKTPHQSLNQL